MSPISSRNIVPWLANSNLPGLCWMAPVNAPRSKPNSSDSSSSVGSAAQFTFTNGLSRAERRRVERPRDQLLAGAALAANEHGDVGVGDALDQVAHLGHPLAVAEQHRVARLRLQLLAQRRDLAAQLVLLAARWSSGTSSSASSNGLQTKSVAPSFIACTTVVVRPWPERTMTGTSRSIFLNAASAASPSMLAGHHDVEHDGRGPLGVEALHGFVRVAQRQRAVAALGEERAQELAHREVVVDDHHLRS